jgi:hypothetical protein
VPAVVGTIESTLISTQQSAVFGAFRTTLITAVFYAVG